MWLELGYFKINPWFENCKLGLERERVRRFSPVLEETGGGGIPQPLFIKIVYCSFSTNVSKLSAA